MNIEITPKFKLGDEVVCQNCFKGKVITRLYEIDNKIMTYEIEEEDGFYNIYYEDDLSLLLKHILTEKEKTYLKNVLRPFKNKVKHIYKVHYDFDKTENIVIITKDGSNYYLPYFSENEHYRGMKIGKYYTLQELGLFEGE